MKRSGPAYVLVGFALTLCGSLGCSTHGIGSTGTVGTVTGALSAEDQPIGEDASTVMQREAVDGFFPAPSTPWILSPGNVNTKTLWTYTTSTPDPTWINPSYSPTSSWSREPYPGGFGDGTATNPDEPQDVVNTAWVQPSTDIWLRTTFNPGNLSTAQISTLFFYLRWDNHIEIYLNGVQAVTETNVSLGYRYLGLSPASLAAIHANSTNTLAVHVGALDAGAERYFDLGLTWGTPFAKIPSSGFEQTPALATYTQTVHDFMLLHGIPAGSLSVMNGSQVVVDRSLGWADKSFATPLSQGAVLRLASNDKVITRGAVMSMICTGTVDRASGLTISHTTPVFKVLEAHGLTALPGKTPDSNIDQVTVDDLLNFTSGVQELPSIPQFYCDLAGADAGPCPPTSTTEENDVQWVYSAPLSPTRGSFFYNSSGYMVLRYLVNEVAGDLLTYIRNVVLAPTGTTDVFIAHEVLANRSPREPWYATLETPYDRWIYLENYTALASSAQAFVRYLGQYDMVSGIPFNSKSSACPPQNNGYQAFDGESSGTWTSTEQDTPDQTNFAVLFNEDGFDAAVRYQLEAISRGPMLAQINAGGPAAPPFSADRDFVGGSTISHPNAIDTTNVVFNDSTYPAPMETYQSARIGNFTYTITGLAPGSAHTVRLHFAETYFSTVGSRVFNITINGAPVLSNFDIVQAVQTETKGAKGWNTAIVETFEGVLANSSGTYDIQFTSVVNNSLVSAIEVQ
jgi:CubicO group peptidase (beta-lactamase class C family)